MITHLVHVPSAPVNRAVEFFWYVQGKMPEPCRYMLLPDGAIVLIINLGEPQMLCDRADVRRQTICRESWVAGQQLEPIILQQSGDLRIAGIRFRPGGALPIFRCAMEEFTAQVIALEHLPSLDTAALREELIETADPKRVLLRLESWVADRLAQSTLPDRRAAFAAQQLQRGARIEALTSALGLSNKHLISEFRKHVGLSPKHYARIQRLQRTIAAVGHRPSVNWSDVAAQHGYCDHSHLINEFRGLVGISPGEYLARRAPYLGYLNVA